jgi:hypothetical protein
MTHSGTSAANSCMRPPGNKLIEVALRLEATDTACVQDKPFGTDIRARCSCGGRGGRRTARGEVCMLDRCRTLCNPEVHDGCR